MVMYMCLYQARRVSGHVYVPVPSQESEWSCISACTKPGESVVMYMCLYQARRVSGHVYVPVPSQESEWSCICV